MCSSQISQISSRFIGGRRCRLTRPPQQNAPGPWQNGQQIKISALLSLRVYLSHAASCFSLFPLSAGGAWVMDPMEVASRQNYIFYSIDLSPPLCIFLFSHSRLSISCWERGHVIEFEHRCSLSLYPLTSTRPATFHRSRRVCAGGKWWMPRCSPKWNWLSSEQRERLLFVWLALARWNAARYSSALHSLRKCTHANETLALFKLIFNAASLFERRINKISPGMILRAHLMLLKLVFHQLARCVQYFFILFALKAAEKCLLIITDWLEQIAPVCILHLIFQFKIQENSII